jgi:hypothetical protein
MRKIFICTVLFTATATLSAAQAPQASPTPAATGTPVNELPQGKTRSSLGGMRPGAAKDDYVRPDAKTRSKRYVNSLIGPYALARQAAGAGISTWRNSPEEWGDRWEGFGRRFASNFGKNVIKQSTIYGLDEAFKLDSHYYRSKDKSVGARVKNALISPVTARDRNGKRVFGFPRIVGTYAGNIVSREVWYPARYDWKDGVKGGTISLGYNATFNLFKEFVWKK